MTPALLNQVERWLAPLDALRRALYRALAPWLGAWIRDREVRVGLHGLTVALGALVGAVLAPLWLLALGPVLLGVPHLVADLRYLVVRPGLHRRLLAPLVGGLLLLTSVTADLRWGLVGACLVPLAGRVGWGRRLMAAAPLVALCGAAWWASQGTGLVIAHAHNLVAVVLWGVLAAALHDGGALERPARWLPAVAMLCGAGVLLSGLLDPWLVTGWGPSRIARHARSLAPGLDPVVATRWVVTFAYAQAVHYGIWLRVMPEESRRRPAPRSWLASLRALRQDFGDGPLAATLLVFLGIAAWGVVDLAHARDGYLRLALFHGPLELGVLGLVAAEGRAVLRS